LKALGSEQTEMMQSIYKLALCSLLVGALLSPSLSAQVRGGSPPASARSATGRGAAPGGRGGGKSVRPPDFKRIRTSVTRLLGWRVGIRANVFPQLTFFEAAGMADALGLGYIEAFDTQKVSPALAKNLDASLASEEVGVVRSRLAELRLKMPVYHATSLGLDEASQRKVFEFAKALEVETIVLPEVPAALAEIDRLAGEFGINVAIESRGDAQQTLQAIGSSSPRIGVTAAAAKWIEEGTKPADAVAKLQDRLMVLHLSDHSAFGRSSHEVNLGEGVANVPQLLMALVRQLPPPEEKFEKCVNCYRGHSGVKPLFLALDVRSYYGFDQSMQVAGAEAFGRLWHSVEAFERAVRPAMGYRVDQFSRLVPVTGTERVTAEERQKIEAASPKQALAKPKKSRKLLVVDLCPAGDFHHHTIAHNNLALQLMAKNTAAFQPVFSNDLNNLKYPAVRQFDAVFINSTVGEVFIDPEVLNGLLRFVREGGGVVGMHSASYASQNLPEYADLLGAADGPHRVEPATLKIEDLNSPFNRGFQGKDSLEFTDEFYHFLPTGPYSRDKVRVLISIDSGKTDMSRWNIRPDNDYALSWIKKYGNGRVFNCSMGHVPEFMGTPAFAEHVFAGIQFALGDLEADTTPSAELAMKTRSTR
ncbi:MAG: ThuA domain-containing protein, partial [Candidatus Korobacteraceae bacterium]